ncbi:hypothetical protein OF83DRAFT_111295 [Amylostereum chailletii]|nr:hypothetical protein OF83DRAFT_111295 [Amylostereum chailletii]
MLFVHPTSTCDICKQAYSWDAPDDDAPEETRWLTRPHALECGHIFCLICLNRRSPPLCTLCDGSNPPQRFKRLHVNPPPPEPQDIVEGHRLLERLALFSDEGVARDQHDAIVDEANAFLDQYPECRLRHAIRILSLSTVRHRSTADQYAELTQPHADQTMTVRELRRLILSKEEQHGDERKLQSRLVRQIEELQGSAWPIEPLGIPLRRPMHQDNLPLETTALAQEKDRECRRPTPQHTGRLIGRDHPLWAFSTEPPCMRSPRHQLFFKYGETSLCLPTCGGLRLSTTSNRPSSSRVGSLPTTDLSLSKRPRRITYPSSAPNAPPRTQAHKHPTDARHLRVLGGAGPFSPPGNPWLQHRRRTRRSCPGARWISGPYRQAVSECTQVLDMNPQVHVQGTLASRVRSQWRLLGA